MIYDAQFLPEIGRFIFDSIMKSLSPKIIFFTLCFSGVFLLALSCGNNPSEMLSKLRGVWERHFSELKKIFHPFSPSYADSVYFAEDKTENKKNFYDSLVQRRPAFSLFKGENHSWQNGTQSQDVSFGKSRDRSYGQRSIFSDPEENGNAQNPPLYQQGYFFKNLPSATLGEQYCVFLDPQWSQWPYQWQLMKGIIPAQLNLDAANGMLCGVPQAPGVWTFEIQVSNSSKNFIVIQYQLVVLAFNIQQSSGTLAILTPSLPSGFVGTDYFIQLTGSGGQTPYWWKISLLPPGLNLLSPYGIFYGTPKQAGDSSLTVTFTDAFGAQVSKNFNLKISTSRLTIATSSLPTGSVGQNYFQKLQAQGGQPPYTWQVIGGSIPQGLNFDTGLAILQGVPLKAESQTMRFQVADSQNTSDAADLVLAISGGPLVITTPQLANATVGAIYYQALSASGGLPPYSWNLLSNNLPVGLQWQNTGAIIGTPLQSFDDDLFIEVMDQTGTQQQGQFRLKISSLPLTITTPGLPDAHVGIPYQHQLLAAGGNPPYQWSFSGALPQGISFLADGSMSGTPQSVEVKGFTAKVTDQANMSDAKNFTLVVNNQTLTILTQYITTGIYQSNYQFQFQAQGGQPPYTWGILSGRLPKGLTLDDASGIVSGIPQETGIFGFDISVTDSLKNFGSKPLMVPVIQFPLKITTNSLSSGTVGAPYNETLSAQGGISHYSWTIYSGGLPKGLILDKKTGVIAGAALESGNFHVDFQVTDIIQAWDIRGFDFSITGQPLTIMTTSLTDGTVNAAYNQTLQAQGGTPPYVWDVISGSGTLPQGLILDRNSGVIYKTPLQAESKSFTLQLEDQNQNRDTKVLSILIRPQPVKITTSTSTLPNGYIGNNYNTQLTAAGGALPYKWSSIPGLPAGLSLDDQSGVISGTPSATAANLSLQIRVTDNQNNFDEKLFTLTVQTPNVAPVTGFIAQGSEQKAGLAWNTPTEPSFDHVEIVRSTSGSPQTPAQGTVVYSGTTNNIVDQNLINDTTYFYTAFAFEGNGSFAVPTNASMGSVTPRAVTLSGPDDPFADEKISFSPLDPANNCSFCPSMPNVVLGAPKGTGQWWGSYDIVSLHAKVNNDNGASAPYGGSIVLRFKNNIVVNGQGVDFTVFENAFDDRYNLGARYMEPATIEVSQDGVNFREFPFDFVPHYTNGVLDLSNPAVYAKGFAGINWVEDYTTGPDPRTPKAGGDSFDLDDLPKVPNVPDFTWIQYIKITSTGDNWKVDMNGDVVRHENGSLTAGASGTKTSGFDLDAVCAVNY